MDAQPNRPDLAQLIGELKRRIGELEDALLESENRWRTITDVTTSYSIHYTKLYDVLGERGERERRQEDRREDGDEGTDHSGPPEGRATGPTPPGL